MGDLVLDVRSLVDRPVSTDNYFAFYSFFIIYTKERAFLIKRFPGFWGFLFYFLPLDLLVLAVLSNRSFALFGFWIKVLVFMVGML